MRPTSIEGPKSVDSKSSWVVPFNITGIEFGRVIKNFTVDIPLIGEYLPSNLEYVDKNCLEIVNLFINNKYLVNEKWLKRLEKWAHIAVVSTNELVPYMQSFKHEKEALIWNTLGFWILDDLLAKLVEGKEILEAGKDVKTYMSIVREVWTGQFPTVDDIRTDKRCTNSESIQYLLPSLIAFQEAQKLLTKAIPGSQNKLEYFFQELQRSIEAMHFIFRSKLTYGTSNSLENYRLTRPKDAGIHTFLELTCVAAQVEVSSEIRNHFLYAVLQDLAGLVTGIVNDLYSLRKDSKDKYNHNYVLILAKRKNIGLEVAVEMSVDCVYDLICEIEKAGIQFIEEFGHDPVVIKVYDMIRHIVNGNSTIPHWVDRYGRVAGKAVRK